MSCREPCRRRRRCRRCLTTKRLQLRLPIGAAACLGNRGGHFRKRMQNVGCCMCNVQIYSTDIAQIYIPHIYIYLNRNDLHNALAARVLPERYKKVIRYLKINNPHGQSTIYAHFPGRSRVFATFAPLASWPKLARNACNMSRLNRERERERARRPSNAAGGAVGEAEMHSIIYITQLCRAPNPSKQLSDPQKKRN